MLGFLVALLLIVVMIVTLSRMIESTVTGVGPIYVALRRAWIAHTVRRESADLDGQYELLLRP